MSVDGPPTAEGDLTQTPFAHLVVYALERKLTGTLLLEEAADRVHTLTFLRGNPSKCRAGDEFAPLGRLLVEEGLVEQSVLDAALTTHGLMSQAGLLGDVLVMAGHVEPAALDEVLERQFRLRMTRLFGLPGATRYRWYENVDALADWGAESSRLDPLELLWSGLELHGEKASSMEPSLAALPDDQPLFVHARAPLERMGLEGLASEIVELLLLEPVSLSELCSLEVAPPALCRRVVFALLLLRFIDLGRGTLPIGVSERGSSTTLARVQLKQTARQRLVAAAEDEVGDGERVPSRGRRATVDPRRDVIAEVAVAPAAPADAGGTTTAEGPAVAVTPPSRGPEPAPATPIETPAPAPASAPPTPRVLPPVPAAPAPAAPPPRSFRGAAVEPPVPLDIDPGDLVASAPSSTPEPEPDSSVRAIRTVIEGKTVAELVSLGRARLEARDGTTALQLAEAALQRDATLADARLLAIAARTLQPHADLKALALEIDELVSGDEAHAEARYQRGCLRKRLGDDAGAKRDFDRVLELEPGHEGARRRLSGAGVPGAIGVGAVTAASLDDKGELGEPPVVPPVSGKAGLLGRLFRR